MGLRRHLGVVALPDHRLVPRRRPTAVVLAVDLHVRRHRVSFARAWLRLKTDSVWPPTFLHASHNLWMQSIFSPSTSERAYTKWVAGDLGLAFVVVAAVFWFKRGDLKSITAASRDSPQSSTTLLSART